MGNKESKAEPVLPPEEKDERWTLTRDFGPKIHEYKNKLNEILSRPLDEAVPRPVHSSIYFRNLPQYQGAVMYLAFWIVILRKMPFTSPGTRLLFWILGVDLVRSRSKWVGLADSEDLKEVRCFDRIYNQIKYRQGIRLPDYVDEHEDWYEMNKPAYRVPVGHEYSMDSWMRFFAMNYSKYKLRPVQWQGQWEQEMCLNMDLHAPHTDHWTDIH